MKSPIISVEIFHLTDRILRYLNQIERLSGLPQNQGIWHSAKVDDAGCRLTP